MKAQLTIEYMMILVIMLLLFNGITLDLVNTSIKDTNLLQTTEMISSSKMMLTDAITMVSLQGAGAKRTVALRAPPDCDFLLASNLISLRCAPATPSYDAGFDMMDITSPHLPSSISIQINGNQILSGDLGLVTISKS
jgi:hypothetical protein